MIGVLVEGFNQRSLPLKWDLVKMYGPMIYPSPFIFRDPKVVKYVVRCYIVGTKLWFGLWWGCESDIQWIVDLILRWYLGSKVVLNQC